MAKCSHGLTSAECYVCASPKYGAPAAVPVTDAMVEAVRDIDMAACYGTEEDPAAGPDMLRTIGEIARKALAEIDSAQAKLKSRTPPAPAAPAVPADWNLVLRDLVALEADGKHADESAVEVWERARATLAADALDRLAETNRNLGLDYAEPLAQEAEPDVWAALEQARDFIGHTPHGDNCFVSSHYPGDPGDRCNCGKDGIESYLDELLVARTAPPAAVPAGWIACSELRPDVDGMLVAVYTPGALLTGVWPARWSAAYQNFEAGGGWFESAEVTHWMPLPAAPEVPR